MASLRDLLTAKTDPRTGALVQASGPSSLRQAASRQQLPLTPSDPLSAARTPGVTPQMAAMAPFASPDVERTRKARESLAKVSRLGEALQDYTTQAGTLLKGEIKPISKILQVDESALSAAFPPTVDQNKKNAALDAMRKLATKENPSVEDYAKASSALYDAGITRSAREFIIESNTGAETAQATPDKLYATPEILAKAGITLEELAILGLTPEAASKMTIAELQAKIQKSIEEQFQRLTATRREAQDTALGQQVVSQVSSAAAESAAAGVGEATARLSPIADAEEDATKPIVIGGRTYTIDDLLKDTTISDLISQYVTAPDDSKLKKDIREQLGPLAEFADKHREVLREAVSRLETTKQKAEAIFESNKKLISDASRAAGITEDALKDLLGDLVPDLRNPFSSKQIDPNSHPLLQILIKPQEFGADPNVVRENLTKVFGAIGNNKDLKKEFASLSMDELRNLGLFDGGSKKISQFLNTIKLSNAAANRDYTTLIEMLYGMTPADLRKAKRANDILGNQSRDKRIDDLLELIDSNGSFPGWFDNLTNQITSKFGRPSLRDVLNSPAGDNPAGVDTSGLDESVRPIQVTSLYNALKDDIIDNREISGLISENESNKDLLKKLLEQPLTDAARQTLADKIKDIEDKERAQKEQERIQLEDELKQIEDKLYDMPPRILMSDGTWKENLTYTGLVNRRKEILIKLGRDPNTPHPRKEAERSLNTWEQIGHNISQGWKDLGHNVSEGWKHVTRW